jgi:predicted O-methyltransferase YrrM
MNDAIIKYAEEMTSDESPILKELREHCYANYNDSSMLSGLYQGRVLSMISKMIRPRAILEIGTYLGYSALCLAEGLADGGTLDTVDINEETNAVARAFVERSEYADRINFRLGEAFFIVPHMTTVFDLIFIDADKANYPNYYNLAFERLRIGGYILADNVLWSGKVLDDEKDESTQALYDFNKLVLADGRVSNVLLPIRDGLMLVRKESE